MTIELFEPDQGWRRVVLVAFFVSLCLGTLLPAWLGPMVGLALALPVVVAGASLARTHRQVAVVIRPLSDGRCEVSVMSSLALRSVVMSTSSDFVVIGRRLQWGPADARSHLDFWSAATASAVMNGIRTLQPGTTPTSSGRRSATPRTSEAES